MGWTRYSHMGRRTTGHPPLATTEEGSWVSWGLGRYPGTSRQAFPAFLAFKPPTKPPTASTHNICQPPTGWRRSTKIFKRFWQICSNSISDLSSICLRSFQFQGTPLVLSFLHHFAKFNIQTLSTPTTWLNLGYIHLHDISHKLVSAMQQCNNVTMYWSICTGRHWKGSSLI